MPFHFIGCLTCREKRVKCDEERPSCNRCTRLHLMCRAPDPDSIPPFVKCRRRSFISQKSRDQNMRPLRELYPSPPQMPLGDDPYYSYQIPSPANNQRLAADTINGDADFPQFLRSIPTDEDHVFSTSLERASAARVIGVIDDLPGDEDFVDLWTSQLQHISNEDSAMQPVVGQCPDYSNGRADIHATMRARGLLDGSDAWNHNSILDLDVYSPASTTIYPLPRPISLYDVELPNSIVLAPEDHNALMYYQSEVGPCQTTRSPRWSFSALLLRLALRSTMTMHLLLAVSLHDLSMVQNTPGNL